MALISAITVTPLERRHRQSVDELLFRNYQVHTHLDWHDTGEWLDTTTAPARLGWRDNRLVGVLAISEPFNQAAWVRVACVDDTISARSALDAMWHDLIPELRARSAGSVSILITRSWIEDHIAAIGFSYDEDVVTLRRGGGPPVETVPVPGLLIRPIEQRDLERAALVDQAAFSPPWQLTEAELRQAQRIASITTVAIREHTLVGYQLSTLYRDGAHLARLAVDPAAQGQGIGAALVADVIERFALRDVSIMTVNTQASNRRSQRLYRRLGFQRNGYDLPVWSIRL